MAPPWRDFSYPWVLLVALGVALGVALLVGGLTSTTAFAAYNSGWDGATDLRDLSESRPGETVHLQDAGAYGDHPPNASTSFVFSPDSAYSETEARHVRQFVRAGGTLVVAEDFGTASNRLLAAIGADARFGGGLVRDERHHDTAPTMPLVRNLSAHPYADGVERLTLNRATTVTPNGTTVVATTTNYSYVDANRNGQLDDEETMQARPVVTVEPLGDGEVVAVGDPSLFINAMVERDGNRRFARNLLAAHDTRLFDTSHLTALPPLVRAQLLLRGSPVLQVSLGLALVVAVVYSGAGARALGAARSRVDSRPPTETPADREAIEAWIRRRHPEWDGERVQRVTDRIMGRKSKGEER